MIIKLPHLYKTRPYQKPIFDIVFSGCKHILLVAHRRSGKTLTALNIMLSYQFSLPLAGSAFYFMPQTNQVRSVIWEGRGKDGIKFIDRIPESLVESSNKTAMTKTLINGSMLKFAGSNNFDANVGTNHNFIIYDEYSLQDPQARDFFRPISLEAGAPEMLIYTPRGKNHGWDVYQMAINNPAWEVVVLTVEDTKNEDGSPVITAEMIEEERRNGVSEEMIMQEYYCSFEIGNVGAYYSNELNDAQREGRIYDFPTSRTQVVHTIWDIGVRDATSIVFMQCDGYTNKIIDYVEACNKGLDHFVDELDRIRYKHGFNRYGYHFAPHDISVREWAGSARSRRNIATQDYGLHFLTVPNVSIQDRINAGRAFIPYCHFNQTHCKRLLLCLREVMREYDEDRKVYKDTPYKNWALHGFDAFTYAAVAWREQFAHPSLNIIKKYTSGFDSNTSLETISSLNSSANPHSRLTY